MKKFLFVIWFLAICFNKINAQVITSIHCGSMFYQTHLALDSIGNIYFSEPLNNRIRKLDISSCSISLIAGTGVAGYSGDSGLATSAQLNDVLGLAFDKHGNLFIADYENHVIRKIDIYTGIITTAVGVNTPYGGYSGDGGPATLAQLYLPTDLVIDTSGNIYICEHGNNCIRYVNSSTGIISTLAGNGTSGFSGDGGQATIAQLNQPKSFAVDSASNIYIADEDNNRIRKVDASTGIINTIAGNGINGYAGDGGLALNAEFSGGRGLTVDKYGNIYFPDTWNNRVRKIDANTGIINTIIGTGSIGYSGDRGLAINAELDNPEDIAFDTKGNIYIADRGNNVIRVVYNCSNYNLTENFTLVQDTVSNYIWHAYPNYPNIADSARWYWGDSTSSFGFYPKHTYSGAGWFNICVVAYTACGDSAYYCQNEFINNIVIVSNNNNPNNPEEVGLNQVTDNRNQLKIYPCPVSKNITIEVSKKAIIEISNIEGQIIKRFTAVENTTTIDVSGFANGMYFVKVQTEKGIAVKKFIKE
jgi:sugar lactone lactonase YvrE